MAELDFLDQVKSNVLQSFQPESSRVNAQLPPDYGQTPQVPQVSPPTAMPEQTPDLAGLMGQGAVPQGAGSEGSQIPQIGTITLQDLIRMGMETLLLGLYLQPSPVQGGLNAQSQSGGQGQALPVQQGGI